MDIKYLSANQVSKKLNVSIETVYNMLKDGRLGGRYSIGKNKKKGSWLISENSVINFLEETEITSIYDLK